MIVTARTGFVSAKRLRDFLNVPIFLRRGDRAKNAEYLIRWGCSDFFRATTLNNSEGIKLCANKLKTFEVLGGLCVPNTTNIDEAREWGVVYCRKLIASSSGKGIVVASGDLLDAKVYTKRVDGDEFRIHVFGDDTFVTQKRSRIGTEANEFIRTRANGWVFCRQGIEQSQRLREAEESCLRAKNLLGLDFVSFDLILNDRAYILEANSSPGIVGQTLDFYGSRMKSWIDGIR